MMQSRDIVKRFLRTPKNGNLDPQMHFSIKVLSIAHMQTLANIVKRNHAYSYARTETLTVSTWCATALLG